MARLDPFEPAPLIAVAVSGGADSLALTLLADGWVRARGGSLHGLVVDHGLRTTSGAEAEQTVAWLAARGIAARMLSLTGLGRGPALAARARTLRYEALIDACAAIGALHLLTGHHAADQTETVAQRALRASGSAGLSGMAPVVELGSVRLLRPLLGLPPSALRAMLSAAGQPWIEDPSNQDPSALRSRLRAGLSGGRNAEAAIAAVADAARTAGLEREAAERRAADELGRSVTLRPEGFAVLPPGRLGHAAMRALVQMVSGASYPPGLNVVTELAASPVPATLAGVRLVPAGRMGQGLLMVREVAAMAPPVPARPGAVWDGRFRVGPDAGVDAGLTIGALDQDAARFRDLGPLPSVVLRTLPALRSGHTLVAVPHLGYPDAASAAAFAVTFAPPRPAAGAPFAGLPRVGLK
jgi:tRNA(Ile)-lysidine synthase